jgi:hypothetical protein
MVIRNIRGETLCPLREVAIVSGGMMHVGRGAAKGSCRGATPRPSYDATTPANGTRGVITSRIRDLAQRPVRDQLQTCLVKLPVMVKLECFPMLWRWVSSNDHLPRQSLLRVHF